MKLTVNPGKLQGSIEAISSKSMAHRYLICAALAHTPCTIYCNCLSEDVKATIGALRALGAAVDAEGDGAIKVAPIDRGRLRGGHYVIDAHESGSTLRFFLPIVCALGADAEICMAPSLARRPIEPLVIELARHGADIVRDTEGTLHIHPAPLRGGEFVISGDISSQFISGLMFAMPLIEEDSSIRITGELESADYVNMTREALLRFGADQGDYNAPAEIKVEGDWSNSAFWLIAGILSRGSGIIIDGLSRDTSQGDRRVESYIERLLTAEPETILDMRDTPDLVPILSVLAGATTKRVLFKGVDRLVYKESNRLKAICDLLEVLGVQTEDSGDTLIINGRGLPFRLQHAEYDAGGDHRMAMSAAVAALVSDAPLTIFGAEAVNKSYPEFWTDFRKLGGSTLDEVYYE